MMARMGTPRMIALSGCYGDLYTHRFSLISTHKRKTINLLYYYTKNSVNNNKALDYKLQSIDQKLSADPSDRVQNLAQSVPVTLLAAYLILCQ